LTEIIPPALVWDYIQLGQATYCSLAHILLVWEPVEEAAHPTDNVTQYTSTAACEVDEKL
jgi:hypothetical protein